MHPLDRKLLRDVWHLRGPFLALLLVVASGIALFVALRSMKGYLTGAQSDYYRTQRFADLFAHARHAPNSLVDELAAIPGVTMIETRVVADVLLDVPGLAEPATGRVVSLPEGVPPRLNGLYLRRGRLPFAEESDAVVVSDAFATANGLAPGDRLGAVLYGRWQRLRVVGTAVSPEFVYEIRGAGDIFPDNRRFGALWMGRHALANAFALEGAFNDVVLKLAPGAIEADVLARVDALLAPYGGRGAYGREDHVSHRFLSDEIAETRVTSVMIPSIFLAVTAFLVHLVLGRLVGTQRDQIAVLKAFGYPSRTVAGHYLKLALVPTAAGGFAGVALGLWFARGIAAVYADFFQFPEAAFRPDPGVALAGLAIGLGAALAGALGSARRALALPPAEAMRPEAPAGFRTTWLERSALGRRLAPPARIVLRHLHRQPVKALLSIAGLAAAGAILVVSPFVYDAVDRLQEVQFEHVQREQIALAFREPRGAAALDELGHLPGVLRAEPYRTVDARLAAAGAGHRRERTALTGLADGGELRRIVDQGLRVHRPPPRGVLLSGLLAGRLGLAPGDRVEVEVLEGRRPRLELTVEGVTDDLLGSAVYVDLDFLRRELGEETGASGAFLAVDAARLDELYARLKRLPGVSGVSVRAAARAGFERTIAESFRISLATTIVFACVLAAGMVYNGARVALSERGRELASLRVLGFTRGEVSSMLLGEQALLTAAALPGGVLAGYGLCWLIVERFQSELFRIPLVVTAGTALFSVATVAAAAAVSGLAVRHRIHRLDLVAVLKTRE